MIGRSGQNAMEVEFSRTGMNLGFAMILVFGLVHSNLLVNDFDRSWRLECRKRSVVEECWIEKRLWKEEEFVGLVSRVEQESDSSDQTQRWLDQLSDSSFARRNEAAEKLTTIGAAALPGLQRLAGSFNPDTSMLAKRLLIQIRKDVLLVRLDAFKKDLQLDLQERDPAVEAGLPLWSLFKESLGDSDGVRNLYSQAMERHATELIELQEDGSAVESCLQRIMKTSVGRGLFPRQTIATILILANSKHLWPSQTIAPDTANAIEQRLAYNTIAFSTNPFGELNRKLLGQWCSNRDIENHGQSSFNNYLLLVNNCQVTEALPKLLEIIEGQRVPAYTRGTAMLYAADLATFQDLPKLEHIINDQTTIGSHPVPEKNISLRSNLGDLALIGLATRVGLSAEALGMEEFGEGASLQSSRNKFGFANNADRKKAVETWLNWRAKNLPAWPKSPVKF